MEKERRAELLNRFERATELPLLVLALAIIPLLVIPFVTDVSETMSATFLVLDWCFPSATFGI